MLFRAENYGCLYTFYRFTSLTLYFDILGSFDTIFRYMGSDRLRSNLTLDFDIRGVIGCVVIWRIVTQLR